MSGLGRRQAGHDHLSHSWAGPPPRVDPSLLTDPTLFVGSCAPCVSAGACDAPDRGAMPGAVWLTRVSCSTPPNVTVVAHLSCTQMYLGRGQICAAIAGCLPMARI